MCATPRLTFLRAFFFLLLAMGLLVLHAFLAGDRAAGAFAGAGVGLAPLAAHGKILPVPLAAVALDFLEPLDVAAFEAAKGAFDHVVAVDGARQAADFVVVEFLGPPLRVDV